MLQRTVSKIDVTRQIMLSILYKVVIIFIIIILTSMRSVCSTRSHWNLHLLPWDPFAPLDHSENLHLLPWDPFTPLDHSKDDVPAPDGWQLAGMKGHKHERRQTHQDGEHQTWPQTRGHYTGSRYSDDSPPRQSPPIILTTLATDKGALYRKSVFGRFLSQTILLPLF